MSDFTLPSLGADVESATLVEWRVKVGDAVKRGDIVAEVETDKGVIEIETFQDGVIRELLVAPGTKVPVGTPLARFEGEGAPAAPPPPPAKPPRATPAAREAARQLGVDLSSIIGTGIGGAVSREDVERAAGKAPRPAGRGAAMRRAIAASMSRSKREIPHYYLSTRMDMSRTQAWLALRNSARPVTERMLSAALHVKAVALAVKEVPELNGFWTDGAFRPASGIHVGFAVSLREGGLVAPALHDADRRPLDDLMKDLADVIARTRQGALRGSELSDPTITVTDLGDLGAEAVYAVIHPPQVAIVGFGRTVVQPWVVDGAVRPCPVTTVSLSADHRASDGRHGGKFLTVVERLLQAPEAL